MASLSSLFILFYATLSAFSSELISWLIIYRTENYQNLQKSIVALSDKCERQKDKPINTLSRKKDPMKSKQNKVSRMEDQLTEKNRQLTFVKLKSTFCLMFIFGSIMYILSNTYDGVTVATLPFTPFRFLTFISHRSIPGIDYTQCSYAFLYMICSFALRSNIQKYFGFSPRTNTPQTTPW